ncbi:uncharacterized protein K460DRAFT_421423 [Cucurbitaria berberidis CBS 394.84]|uniref:F-box domain-containing protein n=1 Tax=Cucurbitaria berberidis CBS 394.84 TaxID=1168544 RepID=A0A9P4G849_9PLEO|nr:uncharacterized protein K460DRAFT_421423 [Cucurbitaria berberidis CBS 394.84]KAF1840475.1 hypothetical protein K460DRAFT_421423 [Cucurbitaria berberidis CBS 394.84]
MDPPSIPPSPLRRKASVSYASSPSKRARSVANPVKVSTVDTIVESIGDLEVYLSPKSSKACLDALPEELVVKIFNRLGKGSLAILSRTNKRYKRIADENLYEIVRTGTFLGLSMIETLVDNSKLAELIKHLELDYWSFLRSFPTMTASEEKEMEDQWEAYTRLLVSAINVRYLYIASQLGDYHRINRNGVAREHTWLTPLRIAGRGLTANPSNSFAHLKHLCITGNSEVSIEDVAPIFRFPSLTKVDLVRFYEPAHITNWEIPQSSSSITELNLDSSFIASAVIAQMVSSIKALKSFRYEYLADHWRPLGADDDARSYWAHVSWTDIGDALRKHKNSLEHLDYHEIDIADWNAEVYPDGRKPGTLGSLEDYPQLKSVMVLIDTLLDLDHEDIELARKLPAKLERLLLRITPEEAKSQLYREALMSLKDGAFNRPNKILTINISAEVPVRSLRLADAVEALKQLGIKVTMYAQVLGGEELKLDVLRRMEADDDEEDTDSDLEVEENDDETGDNGEEYDEEEEEAEEATYMDPLTSQMFAEDPFADSRLRKISWHGGEDTAIQQRPTVNYGLSTRNLV